MTLTLSIVAAFLSYRLHAMHQLVRELEAQHCNRHKTARRLRILRLECNAERACREAGLDDIGKMQVELDENAKVMKEVLAKLEDPTARERMVLRRGVAEASNN